MRLRYLWLLTVSACFRLHDGSDRELVPAVETGAPGDAGAEGGYPADAAVDGWDSAGPAPQQDARPLDANADDPTLDVGGRDRGCEVCEDASWFDASSDRTSVDSRDADSAAEASVDAGCSDPTSCESGAIRCEGRAGLVCEQRGACSAWIQRLDCLGETICCAQESKLGCVEPDTQNCFGCGRRCSGETPLCSKELRRCICDPSTCADGTGCDRSTGSCAPCTTPDPDASDFYVDAKASALGTGSPICPLPTITAALNLANRSKAQAKTIHVNDGEYTSETEIFPLVLADGITIEGSGAEKVAIAGLGFYLSDAPAPGNSLRATVVIGAPNRTNTIRGVTLIPGEGVRTGSVAVAVVDGNLAAGDAAVPDAPPNSVIVDTVIGPGYNVGVHMLASIASGSGGNVRISNSTITGSWWGIYAYGCSVDHATQFYGRIEISSSVLTGLTTGVELYGCTGFSLKKTTIHDSDIGVYMGPDVAAPLRQRIEFMSNTFERLTTFGLYAVGSVDEISGNTFSSVVSDGQGPAFALFLDSDKPQGSVLRARGNRFVGNDVAIVLYSPRPLDATNVYDFGTATDPGQNHFRCNSASLSRVVDYEGFDIAIDPVAPPDWVFHLHGNGWDHAPPFVMTGSGIHDDEPAFPEGADLYIGGGKPMTSVDVRGGFRSGLSCSPDHQAGPEPRPQDAGAVDAPAGD